MKYIFIAAIILLYCCSPNEKKAKEQISVRNGDVNIAYDLKGSGDTMIVFVLAGRLIKNIGNHRKIFSTKDLLL